jgi:hypothetical protein
MPPSLTVDDELCFSLHGMNNTDDKGRTDGDEPPDQTPDLKSGGR